MSKKPSAPAQRKRTMLLKKALKNMEKINRLIALSVIDDISSRGGHPTGVISWLRRSINDEN